MSDLSVDNEFKNIDIGEMCEKIEFLPDNKRCCLSERDIVQRMFLKDNILAYSLRFDDGHRALIERVYDVNDINNIQIKRILFGTDVLTELNCTGASRNFYRDRSSAVWLEIYTEEKIHFQIFIDDCYTYACQYFSQSDEDWKWKNGQMIRNPIVTEIAI